MDWFQHFYPEDFYSTFTDVWRRLQIYAVTRSPVWGHIHHNAQLLSGQVTSPPGSLINVWCQGVSPNAGNTSIICETPLKLWDEKKQKFKKSEKNAHPLILWWQLLHSASMYRIRFTRHVSSHPKLKCPYQLVTGVPPASSQLHRRDVRKIRETPDTGLYSSTEEQTLLWTSRQLLSWH